MDTQDNQIMMIFQLLPALSANSKALLKMAQQNSMVSLCFDNQDIDTNTKSINTVDYQQRDQYWYHLYRVVMPLIA